MCSVKAKVKTEKVVKKGHKKSRKGTKKLENVTKISDIFDNLEKGEKININYEFEPDLISLEKLEKRTQLK